MTATDLIIIGAGHAGVQVAANLRQKDWQQSITLIDAETHSPYERPPLSKEVLKQEEPGKEYLLRKAQFFVDNRIDLHLGSAISTIDRAAKAVYYQDGSQERYRKLVIATGARARTLTIPGAQLNGVLSLRTLAESHALTAELTAGKHVVIVGAGYIGMEVAAAAIAAGCSVTVIEFQNRVMARVTSDPVSEFFTELHRMHGAEFVFEESVAEFIGTERVTGVRTESGKEFAADVVVVGIGITPNDELATEAGLATRDGILVDKIGRTSDPDIYAAGDVTKFSYPYDGSVIRLECIQNAVSQAERISTDLLGHEQKESADIPWFWTVQHGVRLQTAGLWHPDDRQVIRRYDKPNSFSVLYLREGKLAAIDTVNALGDFTQGKKLIASGQSLDAELAGNTQVKLSEAAALTAVV